MQALQAALANRNVQAFLRVIREGETSQTEDAYRTIVGGARFDSFADHPRQRVYIASLKVHSTAAGAYQFLSRTWDECAKALSLPDFSPASQDLAAVFLIRRRGALDDVIAGRLEDAIHKCRLEWASLPGSPYGQPTKTMARARAVYERFGGTYAATSPVPERQSGASDALQEKGQGREEVVHLGPEPSDYYPTGEAPGWVPPPPKETAMDPFTATALSAVLKAAPALIDMFKGDSKSAERNSEAAKVVVGVAKEALQVRNEQELVQTLESDPQAKVVVREAIERNWFEIQQKVEKSRAAARKFVVDYSREKDVRTVVGRFTFIEFLTLVFLGSCWAAIGLLAAFEKISEGTLDNIIMVAVVASIAGIREFWYGSSFGSRQKDERQA